MYGAISSETEHKTTAFFEFETLYSFSIRDFVNGWSAGRWISKVKSLRSDISVFLLIMVISAQKGKQKQVPKWP